MQETPPAATPATSATPVVHEPTADDRTWGALAHVSAFAGLLVPFGNVLGPLVIWLIKKDQSPFLDDQGREALNFQILVTIVGVLLMAMFMVSSILAALVFPLLVIVLTMIVGGILGVIAIVLIIVATIKANGGQYYRYPVRFSFVS